MHLRRLFQTFARRQYARTLQPRASLRIESLESRLTPYAVSGNSWVHPELVTLSFMPDGTNLGGVTSNLFGTMNAQWATSVWQREVLRAAQVWAQVTNLNFALVTDSGADSGSGNYQQGDTAFGDIRIGAYNSGGSNLGSAMMPPPANNYSLAGDYTLNSSQPWVINQTGGYDLFTVAAHEMGHSLGLYHSTVSSAEEYSFYNAIKSSLRSDDIAGIRAIYSAGAGRAADGNDAVLSNGSFLTATNLTPQIDLVNLTALVQNLDLTTTSDHDYYSVIAPVGTSGNLEVKIQSAGLSMLMPTVTVYNAAQQAIGSATGLGQYGSTLTVNLSGVTAGQQFYIKVSPAETSAFGTGRYALTLNFGSGASPTVPLPNTQTSNGSPLQGGGGIAQQDGLESLVNVTTAGSQQTFTDVANRDAVAMNSSGTYLITWSSENQDGSGYGVFGRLYGSNGVALTSEFQINTHTVGDQLHAVAGLNDDGKFVVAWASHGQDADGSWGIYAQLFDAAAQPIGSEFAIAAGTGDQKYPSLESAPDGRFAVAWSDGTADGDGWGVSARLYQADGQPASAAFVVNTTAAGDQTQAHITMGANGNVAVVWTHPEAGGGANVYGKLYDAAGVVLLDEFMLNSNTAGLQDNPAVAMADDGDFIATWSSFAQDGSGWGVYAQRYTLDALPRGGEFRVNSSVGGDQWYSSIDVLENGEIIITWTAVDAGGASAGIFAQQYSAAGNVLGLEILVNTTQTGNQWYPAVAASDSDGFTVVWSGEGTTDLAGVFAQRYQIQGGGGIVEGEDDFYGISEHGNGCGCSSCLGAILNGASPGAGDAGAAESLIAAEHAELVVVADMGASASVSGAQLPHSSEPQKNNAPAYSGNDLMRVKALVHHVESMPPLEQSPPPSELYLESINPDAVPQHTETPQAIAFQPSLRALEAYFAESITEATTSISQDEPGSTEEWTISQESNVSLAGLGLVLGSLWAIRPEPKPGQPRKEKGILVAGGR